MSKLRINPRVRLNNNMSAIMNANNGIVSDENVNNISPLEFDEAFKELRDIGGVGTLGGLGNSFALTAYTSIYTKMSQRQKSIISAVDDISKFYLVEVIKTTIADDALSPSIGDEELIRYSTNNPALDKELAKLKKNIRLDQVIEDITPDLIGYGEYVLATKLGVPKEKENALGGKKTKNKKKFKTKAKGIVELLDNVEQGTVIALTESGVTEGYLVENEYTKRKELRHVADYIKFTLGGQRVKVNANTALPLGSTLNKDLKKLADALPRFIRVGKSMIYPFIDKLKELELLEKLAPASKLNQIARGNLVGMSLPENFDLEQAQKVVRKVEASINKKISIDPTTGEITVAKILSSAGKTRIIPLLGDKGTLQSLDYKAQDASDLSSDAKDLRELILDSVGTPSEIIYRSEGDSKAELLKRNDKYVRKLKRVQRAISDGCRQIAFIHLSNIGMKYQEEDINVVFNNSLVGIGDIEKVEQAEITISLLSTIKDFFVDLGEEDSPFADNVELDKLVAYFEQALKTVGLSDAIKTVKEGGKTNQANIGYGDSKNITDDDLEPEEVPPEEEPEDGDKERKEWS